MIYFKVKCNLWKFIIAALIFIITGCNEYYLQEATVITNRKMPTITTSQRENRLIDIEVSGAYSGQKNAAYTQGKHTEFVSNNGKFDYECASDPNCMDTLINNVPYTGENIRFSSNQWNANVQLSFIPFYKKTRSKTHKLRILTEAQFGADKNNNVYLNFKFGPTYSSIGNRFAIHPKFLTGYSKTDIKYQALIRQENENILFFSDSSYYTYSWKPDSGSFEAYRFFIESGATFEFPLNENFSILTDVSGTYQYLFEYPSGEYFYLAYAEISPSFKISVSKNITIISGISVPYNPDMHIQLPIQGFAKMHFSVGPTWGRKN
jgi:hypothetical protein